MGIDVRARIRAGARARARARARVRFRFWVRVRVEARRVWRLAQRPVPRAGHVAQHPVEAEVRAGAGGRIERRGHARGEVGAVVVGHDDGG